MKKWLIALVAILVLTFIFFKTCSQKDSDQRINTATKGVEASGTAGGLLYTPPIPGGEVILPDACLVLSAEFVATLFSVDLLSILVNDGSPGSVNSRSCFYRWNTNTLDNTGVMLQMMRNPMPDEFPDWVYSFVDAKKSSGEQVMGNTAPYVFNQFNEVGDAGAYSFEAGKYYWRLRQEIVFMLAFNMDVDEKTQYDAATAIAKEIMAKF